jgi:hypothetical protein
MCAAKKRCMPVENPMHAMYIKTSQPTKQAFPTQREKEIRNPAHTRPLANASKKQTNKQTTYSSG